MLCCPLPRRWLRPPPNQLALTSSNCCSTSMRTRSSCVCGKPFLVLRKPVQ
jgi:hypothetical protein